MNVNMNAVAKGSKKKYRKVSIDDPMEPSRSLTRKPSVFRSEIEGEVSSERTLKAENTYYETETDSSTDGDLTDDDEDVSNVEELFQKTRHLMCPTKFYRRITYLYAERKLMVFFMIHFVSTMIVWSHFALKKLETQLSIVPAAAPNYYWKIVAPPLEFGSMHAILLQMTLIPLTMARFSISSLCEVSFVNKILPLNRSLRMHIHLGYTMILIVFWAVIFFFTFFGKLCADGEQAFCEKFTEEIMITGYCILAFLLLVGFTSYFRHSIPYEIFYAIHHVVFIMYFVTIAHTLDIEARKGTERSQTFKWFTSTLLFYFCDRAAMHLNHKYNTKVTGSATVSGTNGSRMIILKLKKPVLFSFSPGQFAFLRINGLDNHWHPFSIASGPESNELEFYIEVYGKRSWTKKLWDLLALGGNCNEDISNLRMFVEVMGPYGTCLAKTEEYSHVLSLGAGTGIVPILSLFKQHIRNMLALDPNVYLKELSDRENKVHEVQLALEKRKGSIAQKVGASCRSRQELERTRHENRSMKIRNTIDRHDSLFALTDIRKNLSGLKKEVYLATRSLYGVVLLCFAPVLGIVLIGLTISWNTINVDLAPGIFLALEGLTIIFQLVFSFASLCIWNSTSISNYVDVIFCLVTPFADWYWFMVYEMRGMKLNTDEVILFSLFHGYMTFRLWTTAVHPRHKSWKKHVQHSGSAASLDCLEMVWTTRSASQASKILPDILSHYQSLVDAWGSKNAKRVCRVTIHLTDTDPAAIALLQEELKSSEIVLKLGRLDTARWIQNHTLRMVRNHKSSYSMLAFCGSPKLANEIHQDKISNDMITAIAGYKKHQMEFISESYGGPQSKKKNQSGAKIQTSPDDEKSVALNTRSEVRYESPNSSFSNSKQLDVLS